MPRLRAASAGALAVASLLALAPSGAGCGTTPPTAIIVAISSEADAPDVDGLALRIERSGSTKFSQTYTLGKGGDISLPGTITLENKSGDDVADAMSVSIIARRGPKEVILRKAILGFSEQRSKLLRMPLRYSCWNVGTGEPTSTDPASKKCPDGQGCVGGSCQDMKVDPGSLPEFDPAQVAAVAGRCFDESGTKCLASLQDIDLTMLAASTDCTMAITTSGGNVNFAAHWDKQLTQARLIVLDQDAVEGWTFTDGAKTKFQLAPGVCKALKAGHMTSLRYSTACAPKLSTQPICQAPAAADGG